MPIKTSGSRYQVRPPPSIAFVNYYMEIKEMSKHTPIIDGVHPADTGGFQKIYRFPNGYGASVINFFGSYGLELAVIKFDGDDWRLTYDTPITDDVLGRLTPETLEQALDDIAALAKAEGEK